MRHPRAMAAALLTSAGVACASNPVIERNAVEATDAVRLAYGPAVRRVARVFPPRGTGVPPCPEAGEGAPDAGYLMIVEERTVGARDAVIVATIACRPPVLPGQPPGLSSTTERFVLERRVAGWRIVSRELVGDRMR